MFSIDRGYEDPHEATMIAETVLRSRGNEDARRESDRLVFARCRQQSRRSQRRQLRQMGRELSIELRWKDAQVDKLWSGFHLVLELHTLLSRNCVYRVHYRFHICLLDRNSMLAIPFD